ncbi:MAG: DegV family protein [Lachnospiraceae bacterium]|nr:DegV family protein [Lachnospiraceae bacterium]
MSKVAIVTDTNSGITPSEQEKTGVFVLPMPFYIDEKLFFEFVDLSQKDFYEMLENDCQITTSMPSAGDVMDKWDELLKEYDEIVYIPMSSGLSSSCQTAIMLSDDYDGKVQVVDNQRISVTQRLSALEAKKLADEGKSALEIKEYLEEHKKESTIYITVDTLKYLKKGGRLTPAVAAIGTLLHIKPVLQIQGEKLDTFSKARTMKQAKQIMLDAIEKDLKERFKDEEGKEYVISIAHTNNLEEAEEFKKEAEERFPNHKIEINPLALSVSCHIGPGALAITATKSIVENI